MSPCLRADRSAATLRFARNKGGAWNGAPRGGEGCGLVLRSPHNTEPDAAADGARSVADAPRRAVLVEVDEPAAAAQQTVRPSRGSCGVGHAS